jgi:hypothetical protein
MGRRFDHGGFQHVRISAYLRLGRFRGQHWRGLGSLPSAIYDVQT